jgi:hypothetical protein
MAAKAAGVRLCPDAGTGAKPRFWAVRGMSCSETTPATTSARSRGMAWSRRLPWRGRPSSMNLRMGVRKVRSTCRTLPEKVTESLPDLCIT